MIELHKEMLLCNYVINNEAGIKCNEKLPCIVCIQMLHYTVSKTNTDDKLSNFTLNEDIRILLSFKQ
jgi:hypothetical protein